MFNYRQTIQYTQRLCAQGKFSLMVCVFGLLSFCLSPSYANTNKVLLLNSDNSVNKFQLAQSAFESSLTNDIVVVEKNVKELSRKSLKALFNQHQPDAIYTIGSQAYEVSKLASKEVPVVFSSILNWHRLGGEKTSFGVVNEPPSAMVFGMISYVFPDVKRIGVLYSPEYNAELMTAAKVSAQDFNLSLQTTSVKRPRQVAARLEAMLEEVDAFWLIADPIVMADQGMVRSIVKIADEMNKPIISFSKGLTEFGAVLSVESDDATMGRQAAAIVSDLITQRQSGVAPQVQEPIGSHVSLNLQKVKALDLPYNKQALSSIDYIVR